MSEEKKHSSSLKLAWRDAKAEATGLGVVAIVVIVVIIAWAAGPGGYTF